MAEGKKTFVAYADWDAQINLLTDEEAGKLFRHLLDYVNDKEPEFTTDERLLKIAFEPIKQQLKRDLRKYETIKEKRSEAGKKGGEKKQTEANQANASFAKQTKANQADNVNDNGNVNGNVNDTTKVVVVVEEVDFKKIVDGSFSEDLKYRSELDQNIET